MRPRRNVDRNLSALIDRSTRVVFKQEEELPVMFLQENAAVILTIDIDGGCAFQTPGCLPNQRGEASVLAPAALRGIPNQNKCALVPRLMARPDVFAYCRGRGN